MDFVKLREEGIRNIVKTPQYSKNKQMSSSHIPIVQTEEIKFYTYQMRKSISKSQLWGKGYFNSTFQTELYILKQVFVDMKIHLDTEIQKLCNINNVCYTKKRMEEKKIQTWKINYKVPKGE